MGGKLKWGAVRAMALAALLLAVAATPASAQPLADTAEDAQPSALVLHTLQEDGQLSEVMILDMLVGQFTNNIEIAEADTFPMDHLSDYTHILYFGGRQANLPASFTQAVEQYTGSFFGIGFNVEQFGPVFSHLSVKGIAEIKQIRYASRGILETIPQNQHVNMLEVEAGAAVQILAQAVTTSNQDIPLIVRSGTSFLCMGRTLFEPFSYVVTEAMNSFFGQEEAEIVRYLRLEDIHPNVDPVRLREVAEYLAEKDIPYLVTVIPTYVHGERELHYSDAPELVKVLQYMQDHGASIVLHGYSHQYRRSETGEGFEFWDVENDRPVYQGKTEAALLRSNFASDAEYRAFVEQGTKFERQYIQNAIASGVQELVAHKLYPLAFEAPHYSMSSNGYTVVAEHFDAYVGGLQVSDATWKKTTFTLFASRPNLLDGMVVYPETLGYVVEGSEAASVQSIARNIETMQKYSRVYVSAYYHPYLGLSYLEQIVEALEQVDGASWLDLKQEDLEVNVEDIRIHTENGEIVVEKPMVSSTYELKAMASSTVKWIVLFVWGGPFLGALIFALKKFITARAVRAGGKGQPKKSRRRRA